MIPRLVRGFLLITFALAFVIPPAIAGRGGRGGGGGGRGGGGAAAAVAGCLVAAVAVDLVAAVGWRWLLS